MRNYDYNLDIDHEKTERYIAILYTSKQVAKEKHGLTRQYYSIWDDSLFDLVSKLNTAIDEFEELTPDYIIVDTDTHDIVYDSESKLSAFSSKPKRTMKEFIAGLPDGKEIRTWNYLLSVTLDITPRN